MSWSYFDHNYSDHLLVYVGIFQKFFRVLLKSLSNGKSNDITES